MRAGGAVYCSAINNKAPMDDPVPSGCGLAIGSYVSQWSGALYLDGSTTWSWTLKIPGYLRYGRTTSLFWHRLRA